MRLLGRRGNRPAEGSTLAVVDEAERTAQREVVSKDVNDVIVEGLGTETDGTVSVLCECGRDGCYEWLTVDEAVYSSTQDDDTRFVVAPGHERPAFERVIDHCSSYLVVEKFGEAGEAADRLDDHEET